MIKNTELENKRKLEEQKNRLSEISKRFGINGNPKLKLTSAQHKALKDYKFAVSQENRYLGSVFVTPLGQEKVEQKTKEAHEKCKRLGMGIEHGL